MLQPDTNYTDYNAWSYECIARGLTGPIQIQGYLSFQFMNGPLVAAVWNGQDEQGLIYAGESPDYNPGWTPSNPNEDANPTEDEG